VAPGAGIPQAVQDAIDDEWPLLGDAPVNVAWKSLSTNDFFELDRSSRTVWLNQKFKPMLVANAEQDVPPIISTLVYFLLEPSIRAESISPKTEQFLLLWKRALTQAAKETK
jgi:hypothetical protein